MSSRTRRQASVTTAAPAVPAVPHVVVTAVGTPAAVITTQPPPSPIPVFYTVPVTTAPGAPVPVLFMQTTAAPNATANTMPLSPIAPAAYAAPSLPIATAQTGSNAPTGVAVAPIVGASFAADNAFVPSVSSSDSAASFYTVNPTAFSVTGSAAAVSIPNANANASANSSDNVPAFSIMGTSTTAVSVPAMVSSSSVSARLSLDPTADTAQGAAWDQDLDLMDLENSDAAGGFPPSVSTVSVPLYLPHPPPVPSIPSSMPQQWQVSALTPQANLSHATTSYAVPSQVPTLTTVPPGYVLGFMEIDGHMKQVIMPNPSSSNNNASHMVRTSGVIHPALVPPIPNADGDHTSRVGRRFPFDNPRDATDAQINMYANDVRKELDIEAYLKMQKHMRNSFPSMPNVQLDNYKSITTMVKYVQEVDSIMKRGLDIFNSVAVQCSDVCALVMDRLAKNPVLEEVAKRCVTQRLAWPACKEAVLEFLQSLDDGRDAKLRAVSMTRSSDDVSPLAYAVEFDLAFNQLPDLDTVKMFMFLKSLNNPRLVHAVLNRHPKTYATCKHVANEEWLILKSTDTGTRASTVTNTHKSPAERRTASVAAANGSAAGTSTIPSANASAVRLSARPVGPTKQYPDLPPVPTLPAEWNMETATAYKQAVNDYRIQHGLCWFCGLKGHTKSQCRSRLPQSNQPAHH